jgi:hypothetical protein
VSLHIQGQPVRVVRSMKTDHALIALQDKAKWHSETSEATSSTTRHHIRESLSFQQHRCENFKCRVCTVVASACRIWVCTSQGTGRLETNTVNGQMVFQMDFCETGSAGVNWIQLAWSPVRYFVETAVWVFVCLH